MDARLDLVHPMGTGPGHPSIRPAHADGDAATAFHAAAARPTGGLAGLRALAVPYHEAPLDLAGSAKYCQIQIRHSRPFLRLRQHTGAAVTEPLDLGLLIGHL